MYSGIFSRGRMIFGLIAGLGSMCGLGACAAQIEDGAQIVESPPVAVEPTLTPEPALTSADGEDRAALQLTVLYDNVLYDDRLSKGWGYSVLVAYNGERVLFDTGASVDVLRQNMAHLDVDPEGIQIIVLSHIHDDHVGGLPYLLSNDSHPIVFIPPSFPNDFRAQYADMADLVEVAPGQEIVPGIYTTGEMPVRNHPDLTEQALVIPTRSGLVVITGCAHPGIVEIVEQAGEMFPGEPLHLVMGGMHLMELSDARIIHIIGELRALGVEKAAPSHCTGDRAIELFAEEFGADFIQSGAGAVIDLGE